MPDPADAASQVTPRLAMTIFGQHLPALMVPNPIFDKKQAGFDKNVSEPAKTGGHDC